MAYQHVGKNYFAKLLEKYHNEAQKHLEPKVYCFQQNKKFQINTEELIYAMPEKYSCRVHDKEMYYMYGQTFENTILN